MINGREEVGFQHVETLLGLESCRGKVPQPLVKLTSNVHTRPLGRERHPQVLLYLRNRHCRNWLPKDLQVHLQVGANFLVGFFVQFTTFYESTEVMLDGGESLIGWIFFLMGLNFLRSENKSFIDFT